MDESARAVRALSLVTLPLLLIWPAPAAAQAPEHDHDHAAMTAGDALAAPAGQAAFGTIADVVEQLMADPDTDWTRVNIDALREHLVDMDRVTIDARIEREPLTDGVRYLVSGTGPTIGSIQRMTASHARAMEGHERLRIVATPTNAGAVMEVSAADEAPDTIEMIRGLGFSGVMALDDHHARHHRAIATGEMAHEH